MKPSRKILPIAFTRLILGSYIFVAWPLTAAHGADKTNIPAEQTQNTLTGHEVYSTVWLARKALTNVFGRAILKTSLFPCGTRTVDASTLRISPESVQYRSFVNLVSCSSFRDNHGEHRIVIDLKSNSPFSPNAEDRKGFPLAYRVEPYAGGRLPAFLTLEDAQEAANALNRLRLHALGADQRTESWQAFQRQASIWRTQLPKPALPEALRQQRLLAENALQEKDFEAAILHYETGLDIEPIWPEGQFNAALLCAELGYYSDAIRHMRAYVELLPDAPDSQRARDQLIIWQDKLQSR
jgi:tetratricopeptide (TPR) repeat protein